MEQPISACAFNHNGQIFAYAVSYDWSKVNLYINKKFFVCILMRLEKINDYL